jgi:hypothetical protein
MGCADFSCAGFAPYLSALGWMCMARGVLAVTCNGSSFTVRGPVLDDDMVALLSSCTSLTSLCLDDCRALTTLSITSDLITSLVLPRAREVCVARESVRLRKCALGPRAQSHTLCIECPPRATCDPPHCLPLITLPQLTALSLHCPALVTLDITGCVALRSLSLHAPVLSTLRRDYCPRFLFDGVVLPARATASATATSVESCTEWGRGPESPGT